VVATSHEDLAEDMQAAARIYVGMDGKVDLVI